MVHFIDIAFAVCMTSVAWYAWWLWYKPKLVKIVSEYTVSKCFNVFQDAMLQVALGNVPSPTPPPPPQSN